MANKLLVVAGPNGSGKSTLYRKLRQKYKILSDFLFINPDEITKELFGNFLPDGSPDSNRKMIAAGKKAISRRKKLLSEGKSFGFETTLSGKSEKKLIFEAIQKGYDLYIVFIALDDPLLNVLRVHSRVQNQGHFVDPVVIVRRYSKSLQNIRELIPLTKGFYLFDNSGISFRLVASLRTSGARGVKNVIVRSRSPQWSQKIVDVMMIEKSKI